jgi:sodium/hydrogen antiporter
MGEWTLPTLAVVLVAYAAVSRRAQWSWITQAMVFVAVGLVVGNRALDVVEVEVTGRFLRHLAEATLALMLFTDAARINPATLRHAVRLPARLLGLGLPMTIALGTATAMVVLPDLGIWTAAVLATILAPTDAALGQPVVSDERLPSTLRQGLNVESGLNDGICVPLLIIFVTIAEASAGGGTAGLHPLRILSEEIGLGAAAGILAGAVGGGVLRVCGRRDWMAPSWRQINAVAVPVLAYTAAVALGGSGFIGAFVAGIGYAALAPERAAGSTSLVEESGELLDALTFLLFGAVLLGPALGALDWRTLVYAVLSLTVIRMVPVALALMGTGLRPVTILFLGWFGPRGLASIVFVLLLVEESELAGAESVLTVVVATVALSVLLHGLTSWPGVGRYAAWFAAHGEAYLAEEVPVSPSRPRSDGSLSRPPRQG